MAENFNPDAAKAAMAKASDLVAGLGEGNTRLLEASPAQGATVLEPKKLAGKYGQFADLLKRSRLQPGGVVLFDSEVAGPDEATEEPAAGTGEPEDLFAAFLGEPKVASQVLKALRRNYPKNVEKTGEAPEVESEE